MSRSNKRQHLAAVLVAAVSVFAQSVLGAQWHPVEKYCATYKIEGMAKGTLKTCQRNNGRDRFEITDTTVGFGPFKKRETKHTIYLSEFIYTIADDQKEIPRTKNPFYQSFESAHESQSAEEVSEMYLNVMGYGEITGTDSAAGVACNIRRSAAMGGSICMTDKLIIVKTSVFGQKQILTELVEGSDGGDKNYDPQSFGLPIVEGPDVEKMLERLSIMKGQISESLNDQEN